MSFLYFNKLDVEIQFPARHLMVGVQCDRIVILGRYCHGERLPHHVPEIDSLSDVQVLGAGKLRDRDRNDRFGILGAVSLLGHQVHINGLADFHVRHCLVKASDHHSCSTYKIQCLAAVIG